MHECAQLVDVVQPVLAVWPVSVFTLFTVLAAVLTVNASLPANCQSMASLCDHHSFGQNSPA